MTLTSWTGFNARVRIDFLMLLSLGNIFQVCQSGCTRMLDGWWKEILFSLQHCIKAHKIIFRVYLLALKEICWSEMKWNNREKLIQFDLNQWSLKHQLFIRWNMMIKWNVHIHEAWHTLVSILNIYFKLMEKKTPTSNFVISVQHIGPCNCACKFSLLSKYFGYIQIYLWLWQHLQPKCVMFFWYECD